MTTPDLAALKAAHDKAAAGEWLVYDPDHGTERAGRFSRVEAPGSVHPLASRANAEWTAMAHNAFPGILARIEELRARVAELEAQVARVREVADKFEEAYRGFLEGRYDQPYMNTARAAATIREALEGETA